MINSRGENTSSRESRAGKHSARFKQSDYLRSSSINTASQTAFEASLAVPDLSPLDPSLAAITEPVYEGETYRFTEDGEAFADRAKDTYVVATKWEMCEPLPDFATSEHLLFVPEDVSSAEVEALAVSVWDSAGWLVPGILGLFDEVTLSGPWRIPRQLGKSLGLPASAEWGYSLQCPRDRVKTPSEMSGTGVQDLFEGDALSPLFSGELPVGDEFQAVSYLLDIATRLGGGLRSDSGRVLVPDPDSLVNLSVFASSWVPCRELLSWARRFASGARVFESPVDPMFEIGLNSESRPEDDLELRSEIPVALGALDGDRSDYRLEIPCGSHGSVLLEASFTTEVPRSLRWEDWADGMVASYEMTWVPSNERFLTSQRPSRTGRMERLSATMLIENLAALLCDRAEGLAVDDLGFIVTFESA